VAPAARARSASPSSWVDAQLEGQGHELLEPGLLQGGHDEEHGVGAHEAGVGDVARPHREVLAQHRQGDRRPRFGQVGGRPAEVRFVGQDAQAGGATTLVGQGQRAGEQAREQVTLRR